MGNPVLNSTIGGQAGFASTQWGALIVTAAKDGDAEDDVAVQAAWEHLYRTYCHPVYAFIRRSGRLRPEAQDLTQDFFLHLAESNTLRRADPDKGRFRNFLLGALKHFLSDASRRERARKRGGGCCFVFLDHAEAAESDYQLAAPAGQTPERIFESRWAAALVALTSARLRGEMAAVGKDKVFDALEDHVIGAGEASYQQTAEALAVSLPSLKSIIHRLRHRYRALLREEVARTVASPGDVDAEMRDLCAVLRAG